MSEKRSLKKRKKSTARYFIIILVAITAGAVIFVYNNRDMFFTGYERKSKETSIINFEPLVSFINKTKTGVLKRLKKPAENHVVVYMDSASLRHEPVPTEPIDSVEKKNVAPLQSIQLHGIVCNLRGRNDINVVVSLDIITPKGNVGNEALLKRENLKVMVQKVIANKTLDDLIVDSLRTQIKISMNNILENGVVADVIFRDFRIDKVR
jgi:flagellar basal body-associated protein FliL